MAQIAVERATTTYGSMMAGAVATLACFALALQLWLTIFAPMEAQFGTGFRIGNFFSYFTILTNLLVAVSLTISRGLPKSILGKFFSRGAVQTGMGVYIALVGVIYSLLLRNLWNPQGAGKLADVLLHDGVPVLYVIYWAAFVPKGTLRWKHAFLWLIYPIAYMIYTLIRGIMTGWYPYPFIDVGVLGYPIALRNAAGVLVIFIVTGLTAVWIGRWMAGRFAESIV